MVKKEEIKKLSEKVKEYVEKNKKAPNSVKINNKFFSYAECFYIFSYTINHLNKEFNVKSAKKCSNPTGSSINEKIYENDYKDQSKRIVQFITQNGTVPNYVTTTKTRVKVNPDLVLYNLSKILVFYFKNNRLPNYSTYNSNDLKSAAKTTTNNCSNPYKSSPHPSKKGCDAMGQNTGYYCGVCALQHSLYKFGIYVSQSQLAKWAGTTTSGTSHEGIRTAVAMVNKKYNVNITVQEKNFKDLGITGLAKLICKKNVDAIIHLNYRDRWGHYESINEINVKTNMFKILNSLGNKCTSSCYCGYIENRSLAVEKSYISGISQKSVLILTKN
ncbi:pseudomurein-binding repeat-containing protein [uncultured Methanobrevibacter sp.]|uniref:pseudomurein-binding repeat-containing protein n=1 Tax=uncultured Methanobrevibacter sp. TaxID=253161 RepID=UPI0025E6E2AD|nr:pseudomurein-binding repeat-containing protein [uncultured Methanobrevibacter sp.]